MTYLVNKDTYRHKNTEVWNILGGGARMPGIGSLIREIDVEISEI